MAKCYVYVVKDGDIPLYVGKGSGSRMQASARQHGGEAEIIEDGLTDAKAFERERFWIAELTPPNNISPGGNGGRCVPARKPRRSKDEIEIDRVGSRVYAARFLCSKLDERNCEQWGVSKVDLFRLREVAHG